MRAFVALGIAATSGALSVAACADDYTAEESPPRADAASEAAPTTADANTTIVEPEAGAADAGPKRFCETVDRPDGAADFFCADFDGPDLAEGFTRTFNNQDAGSLDRNTDIFFSKPASFGNSGETFLIWEQGGPTAIVEVDARLRVFHTVPMGTGGDPGPYRHRKIFELQGMSNWLEVSYTVGEPLNDGGIYTGYLLTSRLCGPCITRSMPLGLLKSNQWSDLRLVWRQDGVIRAEVDGTLLPELDGFFAPTTKMTALVGVSALGPTVGRHAFDDLVIAVKRE